MRAKTSILIAALCFILIISISAQELKIRPAAYKPGDSVLLESAVRREGLQFYFEIRNGGLAELARAANTLGPVTKLLGSGPMKISTADMMAFVAGNLGALANARLAFASYGANGMVALIEAANDSDAQRLKTGIAQLLGGNKVAAKIDVDVRDRLVVAGSRAIIAMLAEAGGSATIVNDREFMRARERFSNDPFFAYMDLASMPLELPGSGDAAGAAYAAGALAALGSRPYAIAMGGMLDGDSVVVRALMFYNANQSSGPLGGLFSSISSAARAGQPVAANFAAPDADLFVDVMLDWAKLYEGIESALGMIVSAQSSGAAQSQAAQSADMLAMMEASLGFSIKHDLLPTLGNEVALSLAGFEKLLAPASRASALQMPRFLVMIALKDRAGFEKLIGRMINKMGNTTTQLARMPYRGAVISYSKSVAYTISGGFFIISGSTADIRRALDARALGGSLATTAAFRAAVGSSQQAMMQAYLSPGVSSKLYEVLLTEAARTNAGMKGSLPARAQMRSAVGLTMTPDDDGLMMEMRVPADITVMALAALAAEKPARYGITSAPASGVGIPTPTTPAAGTRNADGRRVPRMTNDDLMGRRP